METPVLETKRLLLRPVTLDDAPDLQRNFANWNVIRRIGSDVPWPYPENGAETYISHMLKACEDSETLLWGIFLQPDVAHLIGAIEYRLADARDNRGFWLAEAFWNRGIMTEAVFATQDHVFLNLQKERLLMTTRCTNAASNAIKAKTGARKIGRRPGSYHDGEFEQDLWEITRESWAEIRGHSL